MRKFILTVAALVAAVFVVAQTTAVTTDRFGAVVRMDPAERNVYFVFSADSMFEGGLMGLDALRQAGVRASFFFTGNFLRDARNALVIARAVADGHYVGPHSNRHLLLADWDADRTPLVTPDSLLADLAANYTELSRHGVPVDSALWVLPPYEWCHNIHTAAYSAAGTTAVNPTPGILTYRDYTTPDDPSYQTSDSILHNLWHVEQTRTLNGAIILIHLGTSPARTDKLYRHLPAILQRLHALGYRPTRLPTQ